MERALASLPPREDRLDYDRIIFRAGQLSVRGPAQAARPAHRIAWPAALASMTALAAVLLAMLLTRPEPPVVERIRVVQVPVTEPDRLDSPPGRAGYHAASAPRASASDFSGSSADLGRQSSRSATLDLEMLDRLLREGVDPWPRPGAPGGEGIPRAQSPAPYGQLLKAMLRDQARAELPLDWTNTHNNSGASS